MLCDTVRMAVPAPALDALLAKYQVDLTAQEVLDGIAADLLHRFMEKIR